MSLWNKAEMEGQSELNYFINMINLVFPAMK